jgi:hypothetical protein
VALPSRRGGLGFGNRFGHDRGSRVGFWVEAVEEGGAFGPLARPAERPLHQAMDVVLLGVDLLAEVGHHGAEFGDHGLGLGQLLSQVVYTLGRRHGGLNPAPPFE